MSLFLKIIRSYGVRYFIRSYGVRYNVTFFEDIRSYGVRYNVTFFLKIIRSYGVRYNVTFFEDIRSYGVRCNVTFFWRLSALMEWDITSLFLWRLFALMEWDSMWLFFSKIICEGYCVFLVKELVRHTTLRERQTLDWWLSVILHSLFGISKCVWPGFWNLVHVADSMRFSRTSSKISLLPLYSRTEPQFAGIL